MKRNIVLNLLILATCTLASAQNAVEQQHGIAVQPVKMHYSASTLSPKLFTDSESLMAGFTIQDGIHTETTWSENFDAGTDGWTLNNAETFTWTTKAMTGDTYNFTSIDPNDVKSLYIEGPYRYADRGNAEAISPAITVPRNATFTGYVGFSHNFDSYNYLEIYITTDDGQNWTRLWLSSECGGVNNWVWHPFSLDLAAYTGETVKLKFFYGGNSGFDDKGYMGSFAIDGLKINGATEVESISVKTGEVIKFADTSSGSPTSWLWQFPGGTPETSTEQNPTVYYTDDGVYDVSLTVGDGESTSSRTRSGFVTVTGVTPLARILPPATFRFHETRLPMVAPLVPVQWTDCSTGFPTAWEWWMTGIDANDFSATTHLTDQNPKVSYQVMHKQSAALAASNRHGESSKTKEVSVEYEGYITNFQPNDDPTTFDLGDGYGEFPGTNKLGITKYAERYSKPSAPMCITGVSVYFTQAQADELIEQIAPVSVAVYTSENGLPGKKLDFASWDVFELDTPSGSELVGTEFVFSSPVWVNDEFFIVIDGIPEKSETCTVQFVLAQFRNNGNTAYFYKEKEGKWISCADYFPAGRNHTSYGIFPYVRHSVMKPFSDTDITVGRAAGETTLKLYSWLGYKTPTGGADWCRIASEPNGYTLDEITVAYDMLPAGLTERSASFKFTDGFSEVKYRLTQTDDGAVMSLDGDRNAISAGLFDDVLRIKASTGDRVDVFTVAGQKIYSTTASDNVVIATSAWQRGLYIIKVSSPYGTKTQKAIKR